MKEFESVADFAFQAGQFLAEQKQAVETYHVNRDGEDYYILVTALRMYLRAFPAEIGMYFPTDAWLNSIFESFDYPFAEVLEHITRTHPNPEPAIMCVGFCGDGEIVDGNHRIAVGAAMQHVLGLPVSAAAYFVKPEVWRHFVVRYNGEGLILAEHSDQEKLISDEPLTPVSQDAARDALNQYRDTLGMLGVKA